MSEYIIQQVRIEDVHPAPWQPPSRVVSGSAHTALRKSIQTHGLQYPPLVTRNQDGNGFTIADGHRRYDVIKALKWPMMPVLIGEGTGKELFTTLSGTTRPMKAIQWVEVYLGGGSVPSTSTKTCITQLNEVVGRDYLERLVKAGLSPQIWNVANRVVNYTKCGENRKPDILEWLLRHKISRSVSAWMSDADSPEALLEALDEDRTPHH